MYVNDCMTREPVTTTRTTSLEHAKQLFSENGFRHLPVLEDDLLVGILTEGDLMTALLHLLQDAPDQAGFTQKLQQTQVDAYMSSSPVTIAPEETVETAALAMREYRIGALPVVAEDKLVGILTETDLFNVLIDSLGLRIGGARMTHDLRAGQENETVEEILGRLRSNGLRLVSLMTYHPRREGGNGKLVVRARGTAPEGEAS